jgi:hypothetical protein
MIISFFRKLSVIIFCIPFLLTAQINFDKLYETIVELDKNRILSEADKYLTEIPITITSFRCDRSAGDIHDFYSEGDYWWPDPENPEGPYIRKDGFTNPDNFEAHRYAMRRLSIQVPVLAAAYKITNEKKYAKHAVKHLQSWFIDTDTKMNPHMKYAQAIKGRVTGRGIGIIDAIHLVEVVQGIMVLENAKVINHTDLIIIKKWFKDFSNWLMNDQYGIEERDNGNNHSTCWNMQVAQYSKFINDEETLEFCRNHFKNELLSKQMALNGSFPLELERTKPYGYSLFNLDAMIMAAEILSTPKESFWEYKTPDGKNLRAAVEFMFPFIKDKSRWPYQKDVMYFDEWPVRHPSLLFASIAYGDNKYFKVWKTLNPSPAEDEILRNFFIRQPILWLN